MKLNDDKYLFQKELLDFGRYNFEYLYLIVF